jgi:F-type H+-transporting ATPase subunit delta
MAGNRRAKRYAQAIYELATAVEPKQVERTLDAWAKDLRSIATALANEEFRVFLKHAKVPFDKKVDAINGALGRRVNPLARSLLCVMVSQGTPDMAADVESEFQGLLDTRRGVERVTVYSAIPLRRRERGRISRYVQAMTNKKVVLEAHVDRAIIGGLVLRIGDKLLDGSTRTKLEGLREDLEGAPLSGQV